jgi:RND family efflux transporter MFP subunit
MKKNLIFSILALVFVFASCGKKNEETSTEERIPLVRTAVAVMKDVPQTAEFSATVQPEVRNNIAPSVPARIRRIFVQVGDRVSRGQRLVQMDDVNHANLQTQVATLRTTYTRMSELLAVGGISQQDVDNVKSQLDVAETNLRNMEENTYLTSPINGIVTARNFDEGDMFAPAFPLLTVMQINPVKLIINVPESNFTRVQRGMSVDVTFDVFENETFEGKVSLIYPTIDELTRSFTTEITLPNADMRIRPGMFARVSLNFGDVNRVVVPDRSIVRQQGTGDRYVFTLNPDNTVSYKLVQLGNRVGSEFEVLSGIEAGEKVITDGINGLVEGTRVEEVR